MLECPNANARAFVFSVYKNRQYGYGLLRIVSLACLSRLLARGPPIDSVDQYESDKKETGDNMIRHPARFVYAATVLATALLFAVSAPLAQAAPDGVDFGRQIRPLLADKCFACHGLN